MISVQAIQTATANYFQCAAADMKSQRRMRKCARPRQVAMYLTRMLTPLSLPAIGLLFGNRDHTTVMHAIETVESLMRCDFKIKRAVEDLQEALATNTDRLPSAEYAAHVEVIVDQIRVLLLSLYPAQSPEKTHASNS